MRGDGGGGLDKERRLEGSVMKRGDGGGVGLKG